MDEVGTDRNNVNFVPDSVNRAVKEQSPRQSVPIRNQNAEAEEIKMQGTNLKATHCLAEVPTQDSRH